MVGEWFIVNKSFKDFRDSGKISPGILLEAIISGRKKQFLVGDINPNGSMSKIPSKQCNEAGFA